MERPQLIAWLARDMGANRQNVQRIVNDPNATCFESAAERAVLIDCLTKLERQLAAPFKHNYDEILKHTRDKLTWRWDHPTLNGDNKNLACLQ